MTISVKKACARIKWTLLVLATTLVATILLFQAFGAEYTSNYIVEKVKKETNGRYELTMSGFEFSIFQGSVHFKDVELKRDTSVQQLAGVSFLDDFDIHAQFKSFSVTSFKLLRLVFCRKIDVHDLELLDPAITITKNQNGLLQKTTDDKSTLNVPTPDSIQTVLADSLALEELQTASKDFFPPIKVDNLSVLKGSFAFFDGIVAYPIQKADGVNLVLTALNYADGQNNYSAKNLSIRVDSISSLISQNIAEINVEGVYITVDTFHIDKLHYGHIINPAAVNRIKGFRASWLNVEVNHIDLPHLDVKQMVEHNSLLIPKMAIGDVNLHFFKDKNAKKINPSYKALPQELIQNIPFKIALDTLIVHNAFLLIEMRAPNSKIPGHLTVDTAQLIIVNLTNIPSRIQSNPIMELNLDAKLQRTTPAIVNFKFNLDSKDNVYHTNLKAGPMNASVLNDFLGSQFLLEFKSGYIDIIDLQYKGDNRANTGKMDFIYTDLKVRPLEHAEAYIDGKSKRGFVSGVGNMIIRNNNTPDMKHYNAGLVFYEKEYNRDFIYGMIMSLVSGMMSSLGLGNQNEDAVQKKADALDDHSLQQSAIEAQKKADKVDAELKKEEQKEKKAKNQQKKNMND